MSENATAVIEMSMIALVSAQLLKFVIYSIINKKFVLHMLISTGGMPSSHSALVSALTAGILLFEGYSNYWFAISLVFSIIIVHDAMGIRYEASKHAIILNQMIDELPDYKQSEMNDGKDLKVQLGHRPREAMGGVAYGIIVAMVYHFIVTL